MTTSESIQKQVFPERYTELDEFLTRRNSLVIRRYHQHRVIHAQSVGEHTAGVLQIILYLHETPTVELLQAALYHDVAEIIVGDIPAPVTRLSHLIKIGKHELEARVNEMLSTDILINEEETAILNTADGMELCMYSLEERKLGNQFFDNIFSTGLMFVGDAIRRWGTPWSIRARTLKAHLEAEFLKAGGSCEPTSDQL